MILVREYEMGRVDDVVAGARRGTATVLVIQGEPGIGKTALIHHAATIADGFDVRSVRAVESENALSFALISMIVRPFMQHARTLPPIQQQALDAALGRDDPANGDIVLLGAAVLGLLTAAARERPHLLLLDDVHWADDVSLRALMFALRRLDRDPVGAVLALRDVDVPVVTRADFAVVHPAPLDASSVGALIAQITGRRPAPRVAERLAVATAGNPLAIAETIRTLDENVLDGRAELPDPLPIAAGIVDAFARQIRPMPEATQRALLRRARMNGRSPSVTRYGTWASR